MWGDKSLTPFIASRYHAGVLQVLKATEPFVVAPAPQRATVAECRPAVWGHSSPTPPARTGRMTLLSTVEYDWLSLVSSGGFAALACYLIVRHLPKITDDFRADLREERESRTKLTGTFTELHRADAVERYQDRELFKATIVDMTQQFNFSAEKIAAHAAAAAVTAASAAATAVTMAAKDAAEERTKVRQTP